MLRAPFAVAGFSLPLWVVLALFQAVGLRDPVSVSGATLLMLSFQRCWGPPSTRGYCELASRPLNVLLITFYQWLGVFSCVFTRKRWFLGDLDQNQYCTHEGLIGTSLAVDWWTFLEGGWTWLGRHRRMVAV